MQMRPDHVFFPVIALLGMLSAMPAEAGDPMPTAAAVAPPAGFIRFYLAHPEERAARAAAAVVPLTDRALSQLDRVQAKVNAEIEPYDDPDHSWEYAVDGRGDCNKFALAKRRDLIEMGWPREALLLTTAVTEGGKGHLVLVARTSGGDYVLDNRLTRIVEWTRLPYRWVSQQNPTKPAEWVSILPHGA
jgi:predicted transglutaminase-like cysteine proteinase